MHKPVVLYQIYTCLQRLRCGSKTLLGYAKWTMHVYNLFEIQIGHYLIIWFIKLLWSHVFWFHATQSTTQIPWESTIWENLTCEAEKIWHFYMAAPEWRRSSFDSDDEDVTVVKQLLAQHRSMCMIDNTCVKTLNIGGPNQPSHWQ